MIFLVDYENLGINNLKGLGSLDSNDVLYIFYSDTCDRISASKACLIAKTGCHVEVCVLKTRHKNALDFYITATIGRLCESGYVGEVAIVSKDTGFYAVRDYVKYYTNENVRVRLIQSIDEMKGPGKFREDLLVDESFWICEIPNLKYDFFVDTGRIKNAVITLNNRDSIIRYLHIVLQDFQDGEIDWIAKMIVFHTNRKSYCRVLRERYGKARGLEIYRVTKSLVQKNH